MKKYPDFSYEEINLINELAEQELQVIHMLYDEHGQFLEEEGEDSAQKIYYLRMIAMKTNQEGIEMPDGQKDWE